MKEIIQLRNQKIGGAIINAVDARELHKGLESGQDYSTWVKAKVIFNPFFKEDIDFILLHKSVEQDQWGGHNRKDYALTIDTAKKVAMAEQTERGEMIRNYFLDCEKRLNLTFSVPQTIAQALQLAADQARQIEDQAPKVAFVESYVEAHGLKTLTETAKLLKFKRRDLIEVLERDGFLFRRQGRLEPYSTAVSRGLFTMKTGEANNRVFCQTYITAQGIEHVAELYRPELSES